MGYLTSRYPALSHTFISREVQALRRLGVEIQTFSLRNPTDDDRFSSDFEAERARTFYVRDIRPSTVVRAHRELIVAGPRHYAWALARALTRTAPSQRRRRVFYFLEAGVLRVEFDRREVRHVHAHHGSPPGEVARIMVDLPGPELTFSVTFHGTDVNSATNAELAGIVDSADLIVTVGEFGRARILQALPSSRRSRIKVVHCGLDMTDIPSALARTGAIILGVGRLEPEKDFRSLLLASRMLLDVGLEFSVWIAGGGSLSAGLRKMSVDLGLSERVRFLGPVPPRQVWDIYAQASIYCLPSLSEGVPVTIMEAMAMGLPVVATNVGGVPEIVVDQGTGLLVPPGDTGALSRALQALLVDDALGQSMGEAGRARVSEWFDIHQIAPWLMSLLKDAQG